MLTKNTSSIEKPMDDDPPPVVGEAPKYEEETSDHSDHNNNDPLSKRVSLSVAPITSVGVVSSQMISQINFQVKFYIFFIQKKNND